MLPGTVTLLPISLAEIIEPGDDLAGIILEAAAGQGALPAPGDILVIAHKVVSKAEGRVVALDQVIPGRPARRLSRFSGVEAELIEVILGESQAVLRVTAGGIIITRHRLGFISANACVDRSNVAAGRALLLPADPDASARRIMEAVRRRLGIVTPVIICDSHGRPFRLGTAGVCVGVAGLKPLRDYRGRADLYGRRLKSTRQAVADEISAAANLLMGQAGEGVPVVAVRGFDFERSAGGYRELLRPFPNELFR